MKKTLFLFLAAMLLITACSNAVTATPTPTPEYGVPPPSIDYQIVGSTNNTYMVVVDPQSRTDRAGLQAIGDYLCMQHYSICKIWFWDDITKADTSYPVDPDKKQSMIAEYQFDPLNWEGTLVVYTLGDE
jgi:hypothetical protein